MRTSKLLHRLPLAAALLAILGAAVPAQAQTTHRLPRCHDRRAIIKFLGLSQEQASQWRELTRELYETTDPLREQIEPLQDTLQGLLENASPDPAEVGQVVIEIDGLRDEIRAARAEFEGDIAELLTPEQEVKWAALRAKCGPGDGD